MENLLEYAKQYNKFGFNVIPLKITNEGKKPASGRWEHLQNSYQSMTDLEKLNWNSTVNGIGGINNNITSIDFDKCKDENFILNFANELGINSWIVKTGSGFHIHLLIEDRENLIKKTDNKSYILFKPKERLLLSHCEVRINDCYTVLPPSKHNNGSTYSFICGKPVNPPQTVSSKKVIRVLQKYFIIKILENDRISSEGEKAITELISFGVNEGNRHKALVKYFGVLFNKEFTKNVIIERLKCWNLSNNPPLPVTEVEKQVKDLWKRYSKELNGKFHQFDNILLALEYDIEKKLKMILSYSVIEYNSDGEILNERGLHSVKKQYHRECKELVKKTLKELTGKTRLLG